ncbi:hypothetical protein ACP70R_007371 [Stipagrostis hirtigluma subsp. patula]
MPLPPPPAVRWRRARAHLRLVVRDTLVAAVCAAAVLFLLIHDHGGPKPPDPEPSSTTSSHAVAVSEELPATRQHSEEAVVGGGGATCATVEMMGEEAAGAGGGSPEAASLRVRELIRRHFELHGASRVRMLPTHEFCKQGFVLGKASEAGLGNEMYKILTAAALSIMLNRSLIIGQTRGSYPFGEYISYTNYSFTIQEIKHLWRKHRCAKIYGRDLNIRVDNFGNPYETNVLCSDWNSWKDPVIFCITVLPWNWLAYLKSANEQKEFDGTTDAVGIQFFLKNVHPRMKASASALFGLPYSLHARPNTFGELMRAIISPSGAVQEAVDWALKGTKPDIALHMRMRTQRSYRARQAAVSCIKRALQIFHFNRRPQVALVSDTPSFIREIISDISEFAEVLYFDYELFAKSSGLEMFGNEMFSVQPLDFRSRDWGPAPRWAAFVDFFLASSARYAVVTGAHRRVGTTYAQLIAALAATNRHGQEPSGSNFTFFSSFRSNLLVDGLSTQVGWGHIWNRYAGPLSCQGQPDQCALTPLLPPAWWDRRWQSPIPRDVTRLLQYGVRLSKTGEVDERRLLSYCRSRKDHVKIVELEEMS